MLNEELEAGVKVAFLARMPAGLAEHGHVLRAAHETGPVPEGDEHAPMVVVRFFDETKKGTGLWRVPFEARVEWNVDATGNAAAQAMVTGLVVRFAEAGWMDELNGVLKSLVVVKWWVTEVKSSDPQDREKMRVITGHVWVGEK